jgi:hypothetical protein
MHRSEELERILTDFYHNNSEYCDTMSLQQMIKLFSRDSFCHLHAEACEYLSSSAFGVTFYAKY